MYDGQISYEKAANKPLSSYRWFLFYCLTMKNVMMTIMNFHGSQICMSYIHQIKSLYWMTVARNVSSALSNAKV